VNHLTVRRKHLARQLWGQYQPLAYRLANDWAAKHSLGRRDREDLAQVALAALWKAACRFCPEEGFKFITYAWKAIQNDLSNAARVLWRDDRQRQPPMFLGDTLPGPPHFGPLDDLEWAARLLATLPERERRAVRGVVMEGRTLAEVAPEIGRSKERVRQLMVKGIETLKRRYGAKKTEVAG
jgi:DNA-directed RNA polymerase specialized sigma subunit